jgi:hypothetical protein
MQDDEHKKRWREMELKMKFNSCEEADKFWDDSWTECPVCGERPTRADPLDPQSYWIMIHKFSEFLIN